MRPMFRRAAACCVLALCVGACAWLPPPDLDGIDVIMAPSPCPPSPSTGHPLAVVLVTSHAANTQRRARARATHGTAELRMRLKLRRVFVLAARPGDATTQSQVAAEQAAHGDLLLLGFEEKYGKLPLKSLVALRWATERCAQARFLVKTDDDVYVDYYELARHLQDVRRKDEDRIRGLVARRDKPSRNASNIKRYFSYKEYPPALVPPYVHGLLYACSTRTAVRLLHAARRTPYVHAEDVYVTGLAARAADVRHASIGDLLAHATPPRDCCVRRDNAEVYRCQYLAFQQRPWITQSHAQRLKNHAVFCYYFHCKELPSSVDSDLVLCF